MISKFDSPAFQYRINSMLMWTACILHFLAIIFGFMSSVGVGLSAVTFGLISFSIILSVRTRLASQLDNK